MREEHNTRSCKSGEQTLLGEQTTTIKPGRDIPVDPEGSACDIVTQTCNQIFQCRLRAANRVSVQPGDVLGVELPQLTKSGFDLFFISIPRTQDHLIYRQQLSSSVHTSSHLIRQLDDQLLISLEIQPGEYSYLKGGITSQLFLKTYTLSIVALALKVDCLTRYDKRFSILRLQAY